MASIKYLGHASFEVTLEGLDGKKKRILIDPWITNPLSPYRNVEEYLEKINKVDYIIVTHDHGDHLGEALDIAKKTNAKIIAIYDLAIELEKKNVTTIGANIGGKLDVPDIFVVLTPALHSSQHGNPTGVVVGGNDIKVYHAGDTGLFAEMTYIGELYKPDIAMLPIGGHFTMGIREAAKAVELLKPKYVVPMHYGTFDVIKADPNEFAKLVRERVPETQVIILKPGEYLEF